MLFSVVKATLPSQMSVCPSVRHQNPSKSFKSFHYTTTLTTIIKATIISLTTKLTITFTTILTNIFTTIDKNFNFWFSDLFIYILLYFTSLALRGQSRLSDVPLAQQSIIIKVANKYFAHFLCLFCCLLLFMWLLCHK